jgi:hypothetical protein
VENCCENEVTSGEIISELFSSASRYEAGEYKENYTKIIKVKIDVKIIINVEGGRENWISFADPT